MQATIQEKFQQINKLIDNANLKLVELYHLKQNQVIHRYQADIVQARESLQVIKAKHNDQQLERRVAQRKEKLLQQRKHYLQSSIIYSQKCKVFKEKLARAISQTQQLQKQVVFLKEQIKRADKKNLELRKDVMRKNQFSNSVTMPKINNQSVIKEQSKKDRSSRKQLQEKLQKQQKVKQRLTKILRDKKLQESQFETIFYNIVQKVKARKLQGLQETKRQHIKYISDEQLNEFDRRVILEEFLSNEKIKFYFYKLIFNQRETKDQTFIGLSDISQIG